MIQGFPRLMLHVQGRTAITIAKTYFCDNHTAIWTSVALNCFSAIFCQEEVHVKSLFMKSAGRFTWNTELGDIIFMFWGEVYSRKSGPCTPIPCFVYSCPSDPESAALETYGACIRSHMHPKCLWRHNCKPCFPVTVLNCKLQYNVRVCYGQNQKREL